MSDSDEDGEPDLFGGLNADDFSGVCDDDGAAFSGTAAKEEDGMIVVQACVGPVDHTAAAQVTLVEIQKPAPSTGRGLTLAIAAGEPLTTSAADLSVGALRIACEDTKLLADGGDADVDLDTTAGTVWGAGLALAHCFMEGSMPGIAGKTAVELGAGTGIAGLAAAAAGATSVILTDMPGNVERLESMIRTNAGVLAAGGATATAAALAWGDAEAAEALLDQCALAAATGGAESRGGDAAAGVVTGGGRGGAPGFGFDFVLAADVIYCHTLHAALAKTAAALAEARHRCIERWRGQQQPAGACPAPTRVVIANEERWKDITQWWAQTAVEHGLRLVSQTDLPSLDRIPRKLVLREYVYEPQPEEPPAIAMG